ncbi:MAG: RNA methyltransferase [Deltaproteobacteria bacterium]|nr:MAG: RNA methyltransferase [Deltaproteobacteria bacterium]
MTGGSTDIRFLLLSTEYGGNAGACARVLANLGFGPPVLVEPRFEDWAEARKFAVHAAGLLETAPRFDSLERAVADAHWVVGTSCRGRKHPDRKPPMGPEEFASRLRSLAAGEKAAVVFGPESTGLTNAELGLCQDILYLPTSPDYPSLNLAQAVALVAWEARKALGREAGREAGTAGRARVSAGEIEGLIGHMRRTLSVIGYLNPQNPDIVLDDLRKVLMRAEPDGRELAMLRGIFHKMDVWIDMHGGPENPNKKNRRNRG